jgi:hypothetical protein
MSEMDPLRIRYRRLLEGQVERLLAEQQEDGAFVSPGGAYSVYEQNVMYPLALQYVSEGKYHGDERLLTAICRSGDRHARELNEQGQWEVITPGGRWGWFYDEWRLYFWLETVLLLGDRLGAERLAEWDAAIERVAAGIARNMREKRDEGVIDFVEGTGFSSPNHMAWHFLVCRRAGVRYRHDDWVALADELFEQMREGQTEDGFWVESRAPAVGYNAISLLAVGLYAEHRWPDVPGEWMSAIERGMDAQINWTYPGGGEVAEIDGRQRYHGPSGHVLPAICAGWERGAAALRESVAHLTSQERIGNHGLAFMAETARYLERHEREDRDGFRPVTRNWRARAFEAGWRRVGPWQATLSGLVTPRYESRWRLDIANLIGIYHKEHGLLAGGGHSKNDPRWATFTVQPPGGGEPLWLPTSAQVTLRVEYRLELWYGESAAQVSLRLGARAATVRFTLLALPARYTVTARLLRPLAPGSAVVAPDGETWTLDAEQPVVWRMPERGGKIGIGAVRYRLPAGASFVWPRLPFNPYNRQGTASAGEAFAAFEATLNVQRPEAVVRITAEDQSS